jgi:glycosyltransferase involved in cell wall biosynthesis
MKLTVSMITMNEERAVAKVVTDIRRVVPDAEIFLVDSSKDRTAEIATELGCRVFKQFPPKGYGPAMVRALTHPDRPIVVTLDCDGTYPTATVPKLVEMVRSGHDIAGTTRLAHGRPSTMPWGNYLGNKLFNVVSSLLFLRRIRDVHSGMRAYRRETIHGFAWLAEPPALPVELLLLPIRAGMKVEEIAIPYAERIGETTLQRLSSTVWTFRRILRSRTVPLDDVRTQVAAADRPTVTVGRD